VFPHLKQFNLRQWIEENRQNWGQRRIIWEIGSHAELLQKGGIYYRLYRLQYEQEEARLGIQDAMPKVQDP